MLKDYWTSTSSIHWKPSPVVALATSIDESKVAAAREDGSLEVWLVSPGSVGWHHQLTIHGDPSSRVSSVVWCRAGSKSLPCGRLFSSSVDGSVSEWDLFDLKQKIVLESIGVSIWQMAVMPISNPLAYAEPSCQHIGNRYLYDKSSDSDDSDNSESSKGEDDSDSEEVHDELVTEDRHIAIACDGGAVRIYCISNSEWIYYKSLPRVSGRILSVAWSLDGSRLYSGSSDGLIRGWDTNLSHEIYRITVGLGDSGSGPELCIWSLLSLRCGTLVSADSTGSVRFWDTDNGTLLQAHSNHKGDVNALAAAPSHKKVFSAGSDGKVILYKVANESTGSSEDKSTPKMMKKWVYVGYVRAHTHDIRALTVAVPINHEAEDVKSLQDKNGKKRKGRVREKHKNRKKLHMENPTKVKGLRYEYGKKHRMEKLIAVEKFSDEKDDKLRTKEKPLDFSYCKWAQIGIPMLISAGDDAKLFAYSASDFTKFSPHDICPAPQRVPIQLVLNPKCNRTSLLLVQTSHWLDILSVQIPDLDSGSYGGLVTSSLVAQVKSKASRKIVCSVMSNSGELFGYSDCIQASLFELNREIGKNMWTIKKRQLPQKLPSAHCMIFSSDSLLWIIAGRDRRIYVVDASSSKLLRTLRPCYEEHNKETSPGQPPITKMFTSSDGLWLAAVNCFGDIYIFNMEKHRQHWFISRLDGASVTSGGFPPLYNNVLMITTSSNRVYAFDVETKQLGEWSMRDTLSIPTEYQQFPWEIIGLSFSPLSISSSRSPSVIVYSARAMCSIELEKPVVQGNENGWLNSQSYVANVKHKFLLESWPTDTKLIGRKNFDLSDCRAPVFGFSDPVLFVGHLSRNSILIVDKPWMQVAKTLEAPPVHRHIFGS